jgi:hypothetical protein
VRIVTSPEVLAFVRANGGCLWVWPVDLRYVPGLEGVFALEAAFEPPGPERRFARFAGEGIEVFVDGESRGLPRELHLELRGIVRKRVRAYWEGHSFGRA